MSCRNILGNRLLEFTNEEFGTNGITKATQGKLRGKNKEKSISFNHTSALVFLSPSRQGCQVVKASGSGQRVWIQICALLPLL